MSQSSNMNIVNLPHDTLQNICDRVIRHHCHRLWEDGFVDMFFGYDVAALPPVCRVFRKACGYRRAATGEIASMRKLRRLLARGFFKKTDIKRLMNAFHPLPVVEEADNVFIAIDIGRVSGSCLAIVAGVHVEGRVTVVGLDHVAISHIETVRDVVLFHLQQLRELYPKARFVVIPEANIGFEAAWIGRIVQYLPNTVCVKDAYTTADRISMFASITVQTMDNRALDMSKPETLVSADTDRCRKQLCLQMAAYVRYSGQPDERPTWVANIDDSLCIALQMLVYWSDDFIHKLSAHT